MKLSLVVLVLSVLAGSVWLLFPRTDATAQRDAEARSSAARPGGEADGEPGAHLAVREGRGDAAPAPGPSNRAGPVDELLALLRGGDAAKLQRAAAALRRAARTDAALRAAAFRRLLDSALDSDQRGALALVLGTVSADDVDAGLLRTLAQFGDDPVFTRWAILALGAQREPEDDDEVFDLGDRPFGIDGPGGLGITIHRVVANPDVHVVLLPLLVAEASPVREAVVLCLRRSLVHPDVQTAFRSALDLEGADDVAAPLGEALASWARTAGGDAQADVVDALVSRAGTVDFGAYRFRLEDDLARLTLTDRARRDLLDLAGNDRPFALRSFALTVLASHAGSAQGTATGEIRAVLLAALEEDSNPAVRDLGARLARNVPYEASLVTRLARVAAEDPAWNVRYSALDTLATYGAKKDVLDALGRADSDPDTRVRQRAAEALVALRRR